MCWEQGEDKRPGPVDSVLSVISNVTSHTLNDVIILIPNLNIFGLPKAIKLVFSSKRIVFS